MIGCPHETRTFTRVDRACGLRFNWPSNSLDGPAAISIVNFPTAVFADRKVDCGDAERRTVPCGVRSCRLRPSTVIMRSTSRGIVSPIVEGSASRTKAPKIASMTKRAAPEKLHRTRTGPAHTLGEHRAPTILFDPSNYTGSSANSDLHTTFSESMGSPGTKA